MILGAFILPHGSIILDYEEYEHTQPELYKESKEIYDNFIKVGETIRKLNPDVIFITTPHGTTLEKFFGIYVDEKGSGVLASENEGSKKKYEVSVTLDPDFSQFLKNEVSKDYDKLEGIGSNHDSFPLAWGATIPQWFIENEFPSGKKIYGGRYSILSFPRRRLTEQDKMKDEMLSLGSVFYKAFEKSKKKIVIIISGDLSHCHKNRFGDNPYPIRPEISKEYDSFIQKWAETQDPSYLLEKATSIAPKALSCGYTEFMMLQGLLNEAKQSYSIDTKIIQPPSAPTYYGMMFSQFIFTKK